MLVYSNDYYFCLLLLLFFSVCGDHIFLPGPRTKLRQHICADVVLMVFGTDPDRNRALEKPPAAELIPCRRKPLRRRRFLRGPA
jgi:hypothetical protein